MGNNYKRIKQIGNGMKQVKVQEPGKSSQVTHEKGKYMTNLNLNRKPRPEGSRPTNTRRRRESWTCLA